MKKSLVFLGILFLFNFASESNSSPTTTNTVNEYLIEARAYFAQSRYPQALAAYQGALHLDANNARANSGVGLVLDSLGQHEAALNFCENGFVLAPDDPEVYFNLGIVLADRGEYDKALENFLKSISLQPDYPEAYLNAGVCYWHKKQYAQAVSAYQKFFAVHPGLETSRYILGSAEVNRSDDAREIDRCLNVIRTESVDAKTLGSLGLAYGQLGQYTKAVEYFQRAVRLSSNYAKGYYNLGVSYQRLNELSQAKVYYQRAVRLNPKYAFIFQPGFMDKSLGRYDKEILCSQRSMSALVYVGFAEVYYNLGRVYCLQKDWDHLTVQMEELKKLSRFDLVEDLNECRQKN